MRSSTTDVFLQMSLPMEEDLDLHSPSNKKFHGPTQPVKNPTYSQKKIWNGFAVSFRITHTVLTKLGVLQRIWLSKDKYRAHGTWHAGDSSRRTPSRETSVAASGLRLAWSILVSRQSRLCSHLAVIHQCVENRLNVFHSQRMLPIHTITG